MKTLIALLLITIPAAAQASLIGELRVGREYWIQLAENEKDACLMGYVLTHLSIKPNPYVTPTMIPELRKALDQIYKTKDYDKIPLCYAFTYAARLVEAQDDKEIIKELKKAQKGMKTQW